MPGSAEQQLIDILEQAVERRASTVHLAVGVRPTLRVDAELMDLSLAEPVTPDFLAGLALLLLDQTQRITLETAKSIVAAKDVAGRFRVKANFFYQQGTLSVALRIISSTIPPLVNLGLPKAVYGLLDRRAGLLIVAGPYGSGRTTTVASMVEEINTSRKENIVTIERPIEYVHTSRQSLVEQREVGRDVNSFVDALKACQETDVDVIAVEAMPEPGTLALALEFANAGGLAFIEMDTTSVVQTIEEVLSSFPAAERERGQTLLADALLAIVCQRLVPRVGGGLALAAEVLIANEAVRALLAEGKVKQVATILQSSRAEGMSTLDQSLAALCKGGQVSLEAAVEYAENPETVRGLLRR